MKVRNGDEDSVVISPVVSLNIIDCNPRRAHKQITAPTIRVGAAEGHKRYDRKVDGKK